MGRGSDISADRGSVFYNPPMNVSKNANSEAVSATQSAGCGAIPGCSRSTVDGLLAINTSHAMASLQVRGSSGRSYRNNSRAGDTGGRFVSPRLGVFSGCGSKGRKQALSSPKVDSVRSRFVAAQTLDNQGSTLQGSMGDTGGYGRHFGRNLGNKAGGCVAIGLCGHHKHCKSKSGGGGRHD